MLRHCGLPIVKNDSTNLKTFKKPKSLAGKIKILKQHSFTQKSKKLQNEKKKKKKFHIFLGSN